MTQERLHVLALVHRVPYPPNKGEKIRAYHEIKHLAERGHTVDLCTFADVAEDMQWGPDLRKMCRDVMIVPKDRRLGRVRSVFALPQGNPLSVGYFHSFRFTSTAKRWLFSRRYDVAFCYSSPMAEYVRNTAIGGLRLVRIMDFVDVDSDKWKQYAEHTKPPMKSVYRFEAARLASYEREIAAEFDASILVSEAEAATFRQVAPDAREVLAIPNGVDTEYFGKTVRAPAPASDPVYVFVGQMDYFANIDGVTWFAEEVLPRVRAKLPSARFQIVGRAPTPEVKRLADRPGVEVTGGVPDIRDYLGKGTLMVAPLRIARGIQNKVLEGMAARIPVVASPAAFEGIAGKDGEHCVVARDAAAYADALVALTPDEERKARLAANARGLVEGTYAWAPAMQKLEDLMLRKVSDSRPATRSATPVP